MTETSASFEPRTTPPTDPDALIAWAATPEGEAHFARLNQRLVEERLNAEAAGRPVDGMVAVKQALVAAAEGVGQ